MEYIQLTEDNELPDISEFAPFKMVIAIEDLVSAERQVQIANWLVEMGGLYVMICGENSTSWVNPVRQANLEKTDIQTMSPDQFIMITDHEGERFREVMRHAKIHSKHTHVAIDQIIVLHVSKINRSVDYFRFFDILPIRCN